MFVKVLMMRPAARDGHIPERRQIELETHFYTATVTEQGATYRPSDRCQQEELHG